MKQNSSIKKFGFILLSCFLMIATFIFAENDSDIKERKEKEKKVIIITEQMKKDIRAANNKPFVKKGNSAATSSEITPKIIVKSIVGEEENDRYAVIEFEGKEITVRKDQIVENKFKVIDIFPDRMVIYSAKEQRRRTYKLIKEETENSTK